MDVTQKLLEVNWDFSDYNSIRYPYDLNSIPWYPATFISPIPKFLIASLTNPGDTVLDPFGGSGTTIIEALKLNRNSIYNDLNPFAVDIMLSLLEAVKYAFLEKDYLNKDDELQRLQKNRLYEVDIPDFIDKNGISNDVNEWYHIDTLIELLSVIRLIESEKSMDKKNNITLIRKLAVSSILKPACSQHGHFTYITDNCKPKEKIYRNAIKLYVDKVEQICLAAKDLVIQFNLSHTNGDLISLLNKIKTKAGDARKLDWVDNQSVDLILTSPPYLCAQDYIKTMRLVNLFFPNDQAFSNIVKDEIGSRNKRRGKSDKVVPEFYSDLKLVFEHIHRVLKPNGVFCLILGQGKSKVTSGFDTISDICKILQNEYGFKKIFQQQRHIGNRVIQVGGVDKEDIIIFRKG